MAKKRQFEQLLRPVFEARSTLAWGVACIWMAGVALVLNAPKAALAACSLLALTMALYRAFGAHRLIKYKVSLVGKPTVVMPATHLQKSMHKLGNNLWLGWGYRWEPRHTQRAYEIMKRPG
ncbi:MAG: hypothetical protein Q8S92_15935 [Hydrogenophaga sp.]|uniref:hypothetical protein n=1 Tax=Hydrogenophaga sp. TaxID=1904254 RepID=UPI002733B938|nr:hypothetical protein [Hydrogenophaga sp.]MDP3350481.1 hypothetical protein [Hydrogenophaga sp.]